MQKSIVFSVAFFFMSGNDQYGRRLLLLGDTAEIFGFTFRYTDALSSVYEIFMVNTKSSNDERKQVYNESYFATIITKTS